MRTQYLSRFVVVLGLVIGVGCSKKKETPSPAETPGPTSMAAQGSDQERRNRKGKGKKNRGQYCGVYLDGKPVGFLSYAELPRGLEPIYLTQKRRLPFKAGETPKFETFKVPRYRMIDYVTRLGLPVDDIKAVHVHHGRGLIAEVTGTALQAEPDKMLFRFGGDTHGKAIPEFVEGLDVNRRFDHIAAVTIYVKKDPPALDDADYPQLNGERIYGIPYFGDPLKPNGVRLYVDDRYQMMVKRKMLDGEATLESLLAKAGAKPELISNGVTIANNVRSKTVDAPMLLPARLVKDENRRISILLGTSEKTPVDAIALYTTK
ncbi:MAG: hypothetical protein AAF658_05990 [Myxococcota bacterium]